MAMPKAMESLMPPPAGMKVEMEVEAPEKEEVEFTPPDGLTAPDGTRPGETFDATGSFRVKEDGSWCLESVNGIPLSGEYGETEEGEAMEEEEAPMESLGAALKSYGAGQR